MVLTQSRETGGAVTDPVTPTRPFAKLWGARRPKPTPTGRIARTARAGRQIKGVGRKLKGSDPFNCTIRTGHGPANINALRRFAIGAIKAKSRDTVAATIQRLARNVRLVFDYLGMTENSRRHPQGRPATAG